MAAGRAAEAKAEAGAQAGELELEGEVLDVGVIGLLGEELCTLRLAASASTGNLKALIAERAGVPVEEQRLVCGTITLDGSGEGDGSPRLHQRPLLEVIGVRGAGGCDGRLTVTLCRVRPARIYVVGGGAREGADGEVFDPSAGSWRPLPHLRRPRHGLAVASLGDLLLAIGGEDKAGCVLKSTEALDVGSDAAVWSELADMAVERYNHAAASAGPGRVVASGGQNDAWRALASAECFELERGTWVALPDMAVARHSHALVGLNDGRVCAVGGLDSGFRALASAEVLDLAAGRWAMLPEMSVPRFSIAAAAASGDIFAVGGKDEDGAALAVVERLTLGEYYWCQAPPLPTARTACAAVAFQGSIFVLGGRDADHQAVARVECLALRGAGAWHSGKAMLTPRAGFAATVL